VGAQKAALFKMFLKTGVLPHGLIIQDLPEYARNQFPEYMDACVRQWAGIKENKVIIPDELVVDSMGDWVRDLTNEGIEPNPGPPKCYPRNSFLSIGITRWDMNFSLLLPLSFVTPTRYQLFSEPDSYVREDRSREFIVPIEIFSLVKHFHDDLSRVLVTLELLYKRLNVRHHFLEVSERNEITNVHSRLRYRKSFELSRLSSTILLLSRNKIIIESQRYCFFGDDLDLIVSMYSRRNVRVVLHLVCEILGEEKFFKISTA